MPKIREFHLCEQNTKLTKKCRSENINAKFNKIDIIKSCVELVTINGRPLSLLEDSGFQRLLQPIYKAFDQSGDTVKFRLNRTNIKQYCEVELEKIKQKIKEEVKNKIISIQMDIATAMDR